METTVMRERFCGWAAWVTCALMAGFAGTAGVAWAAPQVSVAPTHMAWTSNAWVNVTVSNVTVGAEVSLGLYVDVQGNGVVDAADVLLAAYQVQDGVVNPLGSSVIVDDSDGAANGIAVSRIAHFGERGPLRVIGNYLWMADTVGGGTSAPARFSVTQPTGTVWLTGSVIDYSSSNAVPGAVVAMDSFADIDMPAVWTDTNGAFRLYVPAGASTADVKEIIATGLGTFSPSHDQSGTEAVAAHEFTNDLQIGENALPVALRVVPPIPGLVFNVSGHVYDDQTNVVPGVLVRAEWGDDDDKAVAITDVNGAYHLPVPAVDECALYPSPSSLMYLGLTVVGREIDVTNDMVGADLYCPRAALLVRGSVLAADNGAPVVGASVGFDGDAMGGQGVSLTDGTFEVGLVSWTHYVPYVDAGNQGFLDAEDLDGLSVTNDSVTNLTFRLERGYLVTGVVRDSETNALSGGNVGLFSDFSDALWDHATEVNRHGYYEILAPTGTYGVGAGDFDGYMPQNYTNHFRWEWDNGVSCDPVTLTTSGLAGVDFFLPRAAQIQGVVRGDGNPLSGVYVSVYESPEYWAWRGGASTDESGAYSFDVLPGSNYTLYAGAPEREGLFWLGQCYDHTRDFSLAGTVATDFDTPATNVDFDLEQGGIISGWVFEDDGTTVVEEAWVSAETVDGSFVAGCGTYDDGYFEVVVPPDVPYRISAQADGWLAQYHDGLYAYQADASTVVTALVAQVVSNINFQLKTPSHIRGSITSEGSPLPEKWVEVYWASDLEAWDASNWVYIDSAQTDTNGDYLLDVPPSTNLAVRVRDQEGFYPQQYWSNAPYKQVSTLISVSEGLTVSNIDFDLVRGFRIEGRVFNEQGVPHEEIAVTASSFGTNGDWVWAGDDMSDADGYYGFPVPFGEDYFVQQQGRDSGYITTYFSNKLTAADADLITTNAGCTVSNVDFHLGIGGTIFGRVFDAGTSNSIGSCQVYAEGYDSGEWMNGTDSESDGSYTLRLPLGTYRVRAMPSDSGLSYVDTWYSNTVDWTSALVVEVSSSNGVGGIDFALTQPSYIRGRVTDRHTGLPIAGMVVHSASIPDTSAFWDNWLYFDGSTTDGDGYYSVAVLPGSNYIVQTESGSSCYPIRCWSNQVDFTQATLLTIGAASTVSNIDFVLTAGGRITGHIYGDDGGTPLGDCDVYAEDYIDGRWADGKRTDSAGYYSLAAPTGATYRVRALPSNTGLPYLDEWFEDTTNYDAAAAVSVAWLQETGGIDFSLMLSNLSYEAWRTHYFTTAELADEDISGDGADPDGDLVTNLDEYDADTNPRSRVSVLCIIGVTWADGFSIEWKGGRWARQYVQSCESLDATGGVWTAIHTNGSLPTVITNVVTGDDALRPASFYRIKAER